jgi:hypothetical protein
MLSALRTSPSSERRPAAVRYLVDHRRGLFGLAVEWRVIHTDRRARLGEAERDSASDTAARTRH